MEQLKPIQYILPTAEFEKLSHIEKELTDAWHKRQIFRTETEARFSVLNDFKFPTNAGKYWQSLREQMVHFDELVRLSFDLRRNRIKLVELEEELKTAERFQKQRLEVDRDELLFQIKSGEAVAKDRVREVMQWSKFKKQFDDGSFDTKDVNTHQKETLFKSVLNRARVSPKDLSSEERLSIDGILNGLGREEVNKALVEELKKQAPKQSNK